MVFQSGCAKRAAAAAAGVAAVIALVALLGGLAAGGTLRELAPAEQSARLGQLWEDCNSTESCTEKNEGSANCPGFVVKGRCVPLSPACVPDPACSEKATATRCGFAWFESCNRIGTQSQVDCGFIRKGRCDGLGAMCVCTPVKVDFNRKCGSIESDECR